MHQLQSDWHILGTKERWNGAPQERDRGTEERHLKHTFQKVSRERTGKGCKSEFKQVRVADGGMLMIIAVKEGRYSVIIPL